MWNPNDRDYRRLHRGSFVEPVAAPGVDPGCGELVTLWCHPSWVPLLLGAGAQLAQPSTWATTAPADTALALAQATDLLANRAVAAGTPPTGVDLVRTLRFVLRNLYARA